MDRARSLPRLGLGVSGALGWSYITPRRDAVALIRAAFDAGMRYFDTGHSYCGGEAEATLGVACREIGRDKLFLSTKVGTLAVGRLGRVQKNFDHGVMGECLEESLRRLHCDRVDLLMLHSPPKDQIERAIDFLSIARDRGRTAMIGASIAQDQIGNSLLARCDVIMVKHSLSQPLPPERIAEIRGRGTAIIAKRVLATDSGSIRDLVPRTLRRADIWYAARMLKHRLGGQAGRTRDHHPVKDRWTFALRTVDCALFGTTRIEHALANIAWAREAGCLE